ncbi:hypothetical protein PGTUg99_035042 [Puccinia graminis f. sp. tritici]|uniref:Uncharacterized protein n=1 Tax=Puccinia graminis f. sp. tritici TaxID=56615 RepID=A0A5B0P5H3_PUCGR|nr:hypothetical protein PGTUg99_035042 [Puccinia graminis f. sp. tritici]
MVQKGHVGFGSIVFCPLCVRTAQDDDHQGYRAGCFHADGPQLFGPPSRVAEA